MGRSQKAGKAWPESGKPSSDDLKTNTDKILHNLRLQIMKVNYEFEERLRSRQNEPEVYR